MSDQIQERTYPLFNRQIHWIGDRLKLISFPGFRGVALYDATWFFIKGVQKGSLNTRASSISFNFLLALGPGVVFFLAVLPYLPIQNFKQDLFGALNQIMPKNSYIAIESLLNEIFQKHAGLPFFGLLVSLFFAQKGIYGIIEAFNASYHTIDTRSWYNSRLVAVFLVFIFYVLVFVAFLLLFFNRNLLDRMQTIGMIRSSITLYLLMIGKWLILILLTFFCISFLYYMAPQRKTQWKFFSPGAMIATFLTLMASVGFSYFVNNFAPFNKFFGSIGTLIAIMLWINFNSLTLLIGFELNASIQHANKESFEQ